MLTACELQFVMAIGWATGLEPYLLTVNIGGATMNVAEFLRVKKVAYEFIPHLRTTDAQRLAHSIHAPGREVAKTVLLRAGATYLVAVLPADRSIDLDLAKNVLGASKVELATELDIAKHCPDCELGALPPFGSQYRMKTFRHQQNSTNRTSSGRR